MEDVNEELTYEEFETEMYYSSKDVYRYISRSLLKKIYEYFSNKDGVLSSIELSDLIRLSEDKLPYFIDFAEVKSDCSININPPKTDELVEAIISVEANENFTLIQFEKLVDNIRNVIKNMNIMMDLKVNNKMKDNEATVLIYSTYSNK